MTKKLESAKNFVDRNKVKILTTALVVTTTFAALELRANLLHNKFLEEKGLMDEYYPPMDEF